MTQEALKLALDALEEACELIGPAWAWRDEKGRPAITALREALAQPEQQEPVQLDRTGMTYYKNDKCKALNAANHDCICWTPSAQPAQRKSLTDEEELTNGFAMALHDAVLIRIGADDEATQQATARIDKLEAKLKEKNT